MKAHLLYVEDDESLSFVTRDNLEMEGYTITHCADGQAAMGLVATDNFDLCILDVMLPGVDGFTLAKAIRQRDVDVPIIFLTAKSLKEDRLQGLKIGGDDYLTKPFSIEELILKVEIFLKRSKIYQPTWTTFYQLGKYEFDYENLSLKCGTWERHLTQKEADLLRLFANHPNQVLKRSTILEQIWGEDDYFLGRSLDVFISRLRKYLRQDTHLKIDNIHSVGFKFKNNTAL